MNTKSMSSIAAVPPTPQNAYSWMETVRPDEDSVSNLIAPYADPRLAMVLAEPSEGDAVRWPKVWEERKESAANLIQNWKESPGVPSVHPRYRKKDLTQKITGRYYRNLSSQAAHRNKLTTKPNHNEFGITSSREPSRPTTGLDTPTLINILRFEGEENTFYDGRT